jgi:hypothetical protein
MLNIFNIQFTIKNPKYFEKLRIIFKGKSLVVYIHKINNNNLELNIRNILRIFVTPCSTGLLEKLTGLQLVKKFPAFYGTQRFITAFTNARHLSLSRASSVHSMTPHPTP